MFETTRRHLYLAGFMGTGKTAVGKAAAAILGRPFTDLDAMIVGLCHRPIKDIFAEEGEAAFRDLESKALRLSAISPGSVVALGGGAALSPHNVKVIFATGHTVLLTAELPVIWERVRARIHERPLLASLTTSPEEGAHNLDQLIVHAKPLLAARQPSYSFISEWTLDTSSLSIKDAAEKIANWYKGLYR